MLEQSKQVSIATNMFEVDELQNDTGWFHADSFPYLKVCATQRNRKTSTQRFIDRVRDRIVGLYNKLFNCEIIQGLGVGPGSMTERWS